MLDKSSILVVVWSPIGYEIYLTLREMVGDEKITLIAARNFRPPQSRLTIGVNHHFFTQTAEEIALTCGGLQDCIEQAAKKDGSFTLFAPQMGNFYIRSLIESDYCREVFIYDEGSAAYGDHFKKRRRKIWLQDEIKSSLALDDYFKAAKISFDEMYLNYAAGVKFYDFEHPKLKTLVTFFPDAFPGMEKIQLPWIEIDKNTDSLENEVVALLPPMTKFKKPEQIKNYKNDIDKVMITRPETNLILKLHPSTPEVPLEELMADLDLEHATLYKDFTDKKQIDPYREVALMGFGTVITDGNSTEVYFKQLEKMAAKEYI